MATTCANLAERWPAIKPASGAVLQLRAVAWVAKENGPSSGEAETVLLGLCRGRPGIKPMWVGIPPMPLNFA
jgi:hypothetical protein